MIDIDKELQELCNRMHKRDRPVLLRALEHREFLKISLRDARAALAEVDAQIQDMENSMTKFEIPTE